MTSDQILMGAGLTLLLAVASQVLASRLRIPAIILLLPFGFAAGVITDVVHPDKLLGPAFSPFVSLAVAVILYDAGLGLNVRKLSGHTRRTVVRLVWIGALVTVPVAAVAAAALFGISGEAAAMLGTILVVSGPTVVGPLLNFVRPNERLQRILLWEGSLIDAIGGIMGALIFHTLLGHVRRDVGSGLQQLLASVGLGLVGGVVGAGLLWLLLVRMRLGEVLGTLVQLAAVIAVAACVDVIRDDAGLISAIVMGVAVATVPAFELPSRRLFFETLVSLIVGVLFISISASVSWGELQPVILPGLGLVGVLVVIARPLVAVLSTLGTDLRLAERAFLGWMAPRGIVAASTAAAFSSGLAASGVGGANQILPATFVVIVATVTLYGLTAMPVAHRLGVVRTARSRPLLVGGEPWAVELALLLRSAGLDVLLWAGPAAERERITAAGLDLARGELLATASLEGAEQESITAVYLLTHQEDFNALATLILRKDTELPVYRLASDDPGERVASAGSPDQILFGPAVTARLREGARLTAAQHLLPGHYLLFTVDRVGQLLPVTERRTPTVDGLRIQIQR